MVAGASIIVAMIVKIGKAATGYPIIVIINISDIVPPPIGTAVTNKLANNAIPNTPITSHIPVNVVPNNPTKNIILKTDPIMDPSL